MTKKEEVKAILAEIDRVCSEGIDAKLDGNLMPIELIALTLETIARVAIANSLAKDPTIQKQIDNFKATLSKGAEVKVETPVEKDNVVPFRSKRSETIH